jgi:hypothetical protein
VRGCCVCVCVGRVCVVCVSVADTILVWMFGWECPWLNGFLAVIRMSF